MNMMPLRLLPTRAAACLAALAWATPALAAPVPELSFTAQPTRYVVHAEPYLVDGYGRAKFGQGLDEVRAIVAADLPGATMRVGR